MRKAISKVNVDSLSKPEVVRSVLLMAVLFFVFGFVTWLNAILIPYFKIACELSHFASYLVAFAFYISYFIMSLPASYLLKSVGFKRGMVIGFWVMALGAFIFIPAAISRQYLLFLVGLFTLGSGLAILQTAANSYITVLGPKNSAAQRLAIMGICNKTAGILAPLVLAAFVFKSTDSQLFAQIPLMNEVDKTLALTLLLQRVILPYTLMGIVLIGLGLFIRFSSLPEINTEEENAALLLTNKNKKSILEFPHLILGAFAIFFHVGTHVIAIDTIINYATSMEMSLIEAKVFPSYTLFTTLFGYLIGIIVVPKFISQENIFRFCCVIGTLFSLLIVFAQGQVHFLGHESDISIWFVVLLGLADSMIYAGIWPLALDGLGKFTKVGSSLLIMGLCGQAVLPLFYAHFADLYGLRAGYWVVLPCFLFLSYYAFYGYRVRHWRFKNIKQ